MLPPMLIAAIVIVAAVTIYLLYGAEISESFWRARFS
jgi:hypothetical protein